MPKKVPELFPKRVHLTNAQIHANFPYLHVLSKEELLRGVLSTWNHERNEGWACGMCAEFGPAWPEMQAAANQKKEILRKPYVEE